MITDIKCDTIVSGTFSISWDYNGTPNKITVGSYIIRDAILNKLIDAQVKPTPKILREIKYIRSKR